MAKRPQSKGQARRQRESSSGDGVTYFFLTKYTASWSMLSDEGKESLRDSVTEKVKSEGGRCRLFATHGSSYDSVSIVVGVTAAGAVRIAEQIQSGGHRTTTFLPGLEIPKGVVPPTC